MSRKHECRREASERNADARSAIEHRDVVFVRRGRRHYVHVLVAVMWAIDPSKRPTPPHPTRTDLLTYTQLTKNATYKRCAPILTYSLAAAWGLK